MLVRNTTKRSTFSAALRWTTSTSNVVSGAPCTTAAKRPASTNSTSAASRRSSNVVRSVAVLLGLLGQALTKQLDGTEHSVVVPQPLFGAERQHLVDQARVHRELGRRLVPNFPAARHRQEL